MTEHATFYGLRTLRHQVNANTRRLDRRVLLFAGAIGLAMYIRYKNRTKFQDLENRTRNTFQQTATYHNEHTHRQIPNYKVNNRMPVSPFDSNYSSGQDITKARGVF